MRTIDLYIIRKFLGTFFFTLLLLIFIVIVFDISEKIDDFLKNDAPLGAIIFDYYLNFIPYFVNLFSYLLTFIAVIFFTSRMASRSEIIAILSSGISFWRMLVPFLVSAMILGIISFLLANFIIPYTNRTMFEFENLYLREPRKYSDMNVHKQVSPGTFIYMENFNLKSNAGWKFSLEEFDGPKLKFKLKSEKVSYDTVTGKWNIENYYTRKIDSVTETLHKGVRMDTLIPIKPEDFIEDVEEIKVLGYMKLRETIVKKLLRGDPDVIHYQVKNYERIAHPFAAIILTLIGVAVSSRKVRGGIGYHLGFGLALTFLYILFMQVSAVFGIFGNIPALLAVWLPNIFFAIIAAIMLWKTPR
ncbi:MAG: YjgP/YjgQ family permease [Bacteroidetes bacterium]|nr:MAG: YjgP/YjgQ family permease [Bacteroidota bacterium]